MPILLIIIILLVFWGATTYNKLISQRNKVKEGFSTMDVFMKKRYYLIPNLVATVKGYAAHESDVLERVVKLRNNAHSVSEQVEAEQQMSQALRNLFVQVEAYPQLKANETFLNLQQQLNGVEEDIANARRYYNGCVRQFNTSIEQIPGNIIANMFHFEEATLFEVADSTERGNVKVDFGS